jgi:hypothetical protein
MTSSARRPLPDRVSSEANESKPDGMTNEHSDRGAALLIAAAWISFGFWVLHSYAVRAIVITVGRLVRKFLLNA